MTNTKTLRGEIESIRFRNDENGWTVAILKVHKDQSWNGNISLVGIMPCPTEGEEVEVEGELIQDPKFGWQLKITRYLSLLPTTVEGIKRHLGSGVYPDIGPETARKIVNHFGENTIKILNEDPERINEVDGVGKKRAKSIIKSWNELQKTRDVMVMLATWGVTPGLSLKLIKHYGDNLIETLQMNPYVLADDVHGIGFKKADDIAKGMGIKPDDPLRIQAGIKYVINQALNSGHCFLWTGQIVDAVLDLFETDDRDSYLIEDMIDKMIDSKELVTNKHHHRLHQSCFLPEFDMMEQDAAFWVAQKLEEKDKELGNMTVFFQEELSDQQLEAVKMSYTKPFFILTGGPGTGKTTTLSKIILSKENNDKEILLAAPTGRAAKRMSEVTGHSARTIHRLLEYNPEVGFTRNETYQLEGDLLIIDESSMVDLPLFYHLMKAVPPKMQVLMVGDPDQLPSVGPGNVLRDLINAGVPRVHLTEIFRQAAESMIIKNAHSINRGNPLVLAPPLPGKKPDFYFMPSNDPKRTADKIIELVSNQFDESVNMIKDVQVLAPMKQGECGVIKLNQRLQDILNPHDPDLQELKYGKITFRIGDRVMHIKNNYTLGVFNGDIGIVIRIDKDDVDDCPIVVDYDGILVEYKREFIPQLVLSYAATIHKSQGSEYPYLLLAFPMGPPMFLVRNLLYTGITRAKQLCVICGDPKAINMAIRNDTVQHRNTLLGERINKIWNKDGAK